MTLLSPITVLFSGISKFITRLFGVPDAPTVTEDELYDIIESIGEEGGIEEEASRLIHSALEFDDITVQQVLTPRNRMVTVALDDSCEEILSVIRESRHSRLPVYDKTPDNIVGILGIRRYLKAYLAQGENVSLAELMDPPYFLPRSAASTMRSAKIDIRIGSISPWCVTISAGYWASSRWRTSSKSWWVKSGTRTTTPPRSWPKSGLWFRRVRRWLKRVLCRPRGALRKGLTPGTPPHRSGKAPRRPRTPPYQTGKPLQKGLTPGIPRLPGSRRRPAGSPPAGTAPNADGLVYQDTPSITILNGVDGSYHGQLAYHCALHDFSHCVFRFFLGL